MRLLWCTTGATIVTAALFLASAAGVGLPSSHTLQIGILALVMFFVSASQPLLWSSLMARITGAVAATGLAFVSMFGQIGSFIGPYAFGLVEKNTGDANAPVWLILAATVCGLALLPLLARVLGRAAGPTSSSGGKERFGDGDVTP